MPSWWHEHHILSVVQSAVVLRVGAVTPALAAGVQFACERGPGGRYCSRDHWGSGVEDRCSCCFRCVGGCFSAQPPSLDSPHPLRVVRVVLAGSHGPSCRMDEQFFNLVQVVPDYYGAGHDATFYFLDFPRWGDTQKARATCSLESAALFCAENAEKTLAELIARSERGWAIAPYVETTPPRKHNLRCCFV